MINTFINNFYLNKCIITRDKLLEFINDNFKDKEKRTAKAVINILNLKDKYHKKKP